MAEPSTKVLDPNGDLLIIVTAPTGPFAVWDEPADTDEGEPSTPNGDKNEEEASESELRIKASSKHLGLASQRFGRMLRNSWPDLSVVHAEDGLRHWATETVDLAAFVLVMDVIHGRNRSVPRSVDLEMLAKIAVVVDDLQCHEAFDVFTDLWISKLKDSSPPGGLSYSREMVLWILIASIFPDAEVFEYCTRVATQYSTGPIPSMDLPIRGSIIDAVESRRVGLIEKIVASLYDLVEEVIDGRKSCSLECNCMLLGALIKQIHSSDVLYPRPSTPYAGLSVSTIVSLIRKFETPRWIQPDQNNAYGHNYYSQHPCTINSSLDPIIKSLEAEIKGLALERDL